MPVYMIIDIDAKNEDLYSRYIEKVADVVERYGGKYLVRGGKVTPIEGDWNPQRIIVLEFESMDRLEECFSSDEYRELAPFRERSTSSSAIVVEGYMPGEEGGE